MVSKKITSESAEPEPQASAWVSAGRIARAHGVHGAMRVVLDISLGELLTPPKTLQIRRRNRTAIETAVVKEWREIHRALLLSLEPSPTREEAMALAGAEILISRDCLAPPAPDEYYFFELLGAELIDEEGACLGKIDDLLDNQGQALLAVTDTSGKAQLLPLVPAFCKYYDRTARRLTVIIPEDLWE